MGGASVTVAPQAATNQALVNFQQTSTTKWQMGKQTDDTFVLFDNAATKNIISCTTGTPGTTNLINNNVIVSTGLTSGSLNPFFVSDAVSGNSVRAVVNNTSTGNNSIAGLEVVTGVANAFGLIDLNNQVANPILNFGWGAGVTGGLNINSAGTARVLINSGMQVGAAPTGGDKGVGTINVSSGIFLNNAVYTNPDYVLEYEYTGKIVKHADKDGAKDYTGRMKLDDLNQFMKENHRLPRIDDNPADIFRRSDIALEKIEELTLYIIELHKRIEKLESEH